MPQYPPASRNPKPRAAPPGGVGEFREEARPVCRLRHLSVHTEESFVQTIRRFIHFHDWLQRHCKIGALEAEVALHEGCWSP